MQLPELELSEVLNITDLPADVTAPNDLAAANDLALPEEMRIPADLGPKSGDQPAGSTPADNAVATVDHVEPQPAIGLDNAVNDSPPVDDQVPAPDVSESELNLPQLPTAQPADSQPADSPTR